MLVLALHCFYKDYFYDEIICLNCFSSITARLLWCRAGLNLFRYLSSIHPISVCFSAMLSLKERNNGFMQLHNSFDIGMKGYCFQSNCPNYSLYYICYLYYYE